MNNIIINEQYFNVDEIPLEKLVPPFVIKCNNGCGLIKLVTSPIEDFCALRKSISKWLEYDDFGIERHYRNVKNAIFLEELLPIKNEEIIDYKIWCFNGKAFSVLTCSERTDKSVVLGSYDLEWNYHPEHLKSNKHFFIGSEPIAKPINFEEMLKIAETLSKNFLEVRVDLYNINGRIYFGEFTFTSLGGMMNYYTEDFLLTLGNQLLLDKTSLA